MRALHHDPDARPVLGRQPDVRKLTPSKPFAWYGTWEEGHRFSRFQEAALMKRGADPLTAPAMLVKRQAKREEHVWPFTELPPLFAMECPVIGKAADGRVRVIAPDGSLKLVFASGWSHRPFRQPRDGWGVPA